MTVTTDAAKHDGTITPHEPKVHDAEPEPVVQATAEEPAKPSNQPTANIQHGTSKNNNSNKAQLRNLGTDGTMIACPHCQARGVTKIGHEAGCPTIMGCILIALLFWPLCWVPFCVPSCQTTNHFCQKCNRKVGTHEACT